MPVSYRQTFSAERVRTRVAMLGDRYQEVLEALSGWNESGVPLTGKTAAGQWEPVPCGDDSGLFYLVPLLSRATGASATLALNIFLLGMIIFSAIAGLLGLWLTARRPWQRVLSVVPVVAGSYASYKMGDVYVVQASLVLILIPWLLYGLSTRPSAGCRFLIAFLAGVLMGFGQWIRTQSLSALLVFFLVLVLANPLRLTMKLMLILTLMTGISLPLLYARFPIKARDRFLAAHLSNYQPPLNQHLLWHTAYLGLSYLTNPYVSAWRDVVAVEYVQSLDPRVIYGSDEYERLLRLRVKQIAQLDPRFLFYTTAAKAGVLACILLLSTNFGLLAAIRRPKSRQVELAFWLAIACGGAPGLIAIPLPQYVLGMITIAFYYWYYSLIFYFERASHQQSNPVDGVGSPMTVSVGSAC
jgi:hypothetical protein